MIPSEKKLCDFTILLSLYIHDIISILMKFSKAIINIFEVKDMTFVVY